MKCFPTTTSRSVNPAIRAMKQTPWGVLAIVTHAASTPAGYAEVGRGRLVHASWPADWVIRPETTCRGRGAGPSKGPLHGHVQRDLIALMKMCGRRRRRRRYGWMDGGRGGGVHTEEQKGRQ